MAQYWGLDLGVQSYCFRKFENEQMTGMLKECGINAIELCRVHIDVNDPAAQDRVIQLYKDNGIGFNSFGINTVTANEEEMRPYFELGKKLGVTTLGISPNPESYDLLNRLLEEYDLKAAIHNHGKKDQKFGSSDQLAAALSALSDRTGLCVDTGWFIDSEEDPAAVIRRFAGRIYGVHLKDFDYTPEGERLETVLGEGRLNLPEVLTALQDVGFQGYLTLEYEGEPDQPVPNIIRCVEQFKQAYAVVAK